MKRHGIRHFECDECGMVWSEPSRDRFSPSGVDCPNIIIGKFPCGTWCVPCGNEESDTVKVDKFGNLCKDGVA